MTFFCLSWIIIISLFLFIFKDSVFLVIHSITSSVPFFSNIEVYIYSFPVFLISSGSSISFTKSYLFSNIKLSFLLIISNIFLSFSLKGFDISNIAIIRSLFSAIVIALSIPIFSTFSSVSLIPAVSIILILIPLIFKSSSILSLVVPSISVTIALSLFNKLFKSDDFPALGLPIIETFIPSFILLPTSKVASNLFKSFNISVTVDTISSVSFSSVSYSG